MANNRKNCGVLLTPDAYIKNCWESGLKLGLPEELLTQSLVEFLAQRSQNQNNRETADVGDLRVAHILYTLEVKLDISLNPSDLPPVPANPDAGKFANLVLVLSKTTLYNLVRANGIISYIDLQRVRNAKGAKTPKGNYWLWMQGGLLYKGKCVNDATAIFSANERGGTCKEGLFQYTYYSALLDECFMDFAGSRNDDGGVPCLDRWGGGLGLRADLSGNAHSYYGAVSAGVVP